MKLLAPKTKTEICIDLAKAYSGFRDYDSALAYHEKTYQWVQELEPDREVFGE